MVTMTETNNSPVCITDSFIAPWGLANEELPMHLIWKGEFDEICVRYPKNFDICSIYNVGNGITYPSAEDNGGEINFRTRDLTTESYIGLVFTCPDIYDESVTEHPIYVDLYKNGSVIERWSGKTHIIRPQIKIVDCPDVVVIIEEKTANTRDEMTTINVDEDSNEIEVNLRYVGFGMAQVKVDARAEGELISKEDTIYQDFIQAMLDAEIHLQDIDELQEIPEEWTVDGDYEIPQEEIEEIVRETREATTKESLADEHNSEDLYLLADILEKAEESANSGQSPSIYQYVETMLLTSILDVVDRHPTENVSMDKPDIKIETEAKAREMTIECKLKDSLDNEYDSVEAKMDVDDRREEGGGIFEAELITNWENYQVDPDEVFG